MFEKLTDEMRRAIVVASQEAHALGEKEIDTEHLLLGITDEPNDATAALEFFGISVEEVRKQIIALVDSGREPTREDRHLPFTPGASRAFVTSDTLLWRMRRNARSPVLFLYALLEAEGIARLVLLREKLDAERLYGYIVLNSN
jgi:ATP-dependent Clp protease ATP-binding subunit ClpA